VMDLDAFQPVSEGSLPFERAKSKERLHQNLLGKVLSIIWVPRDVSAVSDNPFLMAKDQRLKGSQVPLARLLCLLYEFSIDLDGGGSIVGIAVHANPASHTASLPGYRRRGVLQ
jgi:hypothetical protein